MKHIDQNVVSILTQVQVLDMGYKKGTSPPAPPEDGEGILIGSKGISKTLINRYHQNI